MSPIAQILDAVENAEPVILIFTESKPGDRALYADVIVPRNYVQDANGVHHRVADADVTSLAVMDRKGDWKHVNVADVASVQCV
jgi:hypothetical protein